MKASDLKKTSLTAEEIFKNISDSNQDNSGINKFFVPHFRYISDEEILKLIKMGFKVGHGEWIRGDWGFVIEW